MPVSSIKATIHADISRVWNVVTDVGRYCTWRSDLSRMEARGERRFAEFTRGGYATHFTVTVCVPESRWGLDMYNTNICGHWVGEFRASGGETEVVFTEDVSARKLLIRPFVRGYLRRQQARFIADLKAYLERNLD